jgi:hypothetical protein
MPGAASFVCALPHEYNWSHDIKWYRDVNVVHLTRVAGM